MAKFTIQQYKDFAVMFKQSETAEDLKLLIIQYFEHNNPKFDRWKFNKYLDN